MEKPIERFFRNLQDDIMSVMNEDLDVGGTPVQAFTRIATDRLADAGETANVIIAYDERNLTRAGQHMINGYAISDNYETVDLFITIHNNNNEAVKLSKSEIDTAAKRISNFFHKAINKQYVDELDPATQIYQLAHTLQKSKPLKENLVRVNAIILTNNFYDGAIPKKEAIEQGDEWGTGGEINFFFRVIDLNYLYNISDKPHLPIELDFSKLGYEVPCIKAPVIIDTYQSYLAIVPGILLAKIYEEHGQKLLEQNVRTFLQFSGKINKGIRHTINNNPEMFFAYNNGIAATAEEIRLERGSHGALIISYIKDLQIVNGGQTTASLCHTWRKDRAVLSGIAVPMKLNIINNKENYPKIVERIAEYANTQNKVSFSDLTANNPFYVELEKLSRAIVAPHVAGQTVQTHWFFERSRAQYKNQRAKDGNTLSKLKSFDARNPKNQLFTKEELAKYVNTFTLIEKTKEGKPNLIVGPNSVVQGSQKNHDAFIKYNLPKGLPDSIWFEDAIAKAILFRTTENEYGRAPNAIGDLRYVTVPYTLAYLNYYLKQNPINWYRIWQHQEVSEEMRTLIKDLLYKIEALIKEKSPGSLYGQFAKDSACWLAIRQSGFSPDITSINQDLIDLENPPKRMAKGKEVIDATIAEISRSSLSNISKLIWQDILNWNLVDEKLNPSHIAAISDLLSNGKLNVPILNEALDLTARYIPELLQTQDVQESENAIELRATRMIEWIKENKHSTPKDYYTFIKQVRDGVVLDSVEVQAKFSALEKWLSDFNYPNKLIL
ncbi:AIPR family protein [Lacibacter sp. H375]|uniref:AIPR family protein n=1 Tax=Lacibacter sp. H375 TaxID=3133424 RepID=UPI0030C5F829